MDFLLFYCGVGAAGPGGLRALIDGLRIDGVDVQKVALITLGRGRLVCRSSQQHRPSLFIGPTIGAKTTIKNYEKFIIANM